MLIYIYNSFHEVNTDICNYLLLLFYIFKLIEVYQLKLIGWIQSIAANYCTCVGKQANTILYKMIPKPFVYWVPFITSDSDPQITVLLIYLKLNIS